MITQLDFAVLDWIQAHLRGPFLDAAMPVVTLFGNAGLVWIVLTVIFLCNRKRRACGIAMAAGLTGGLLVTNLLLKNLVARPRPCWIRPDVSMLVPVPTDYSFPSGHATSCFCCAVILMHCDRRFGVPALILAAAISFSRLYLYVHFPSDVLAGALIGSAVALLVLRGMRRLEPKLGAKT